MFSAVKLSNPAKRAKDSQVRSETGGGSEITFAVFNTTKTFTAVRQAI